MKVNGILIDKLNNQGKLKNLALFIYIKSLHSNSVIYNCCYERLSAKFKMSESAVRKHIAFFIKNGWAEIQKTKTKNNLILKRLSSISNEKKLVFYDVNGDTPKQVLNNIYAQLLKHNANQAKWYSQLRHDLDSGRKQLTGKTGWKVNKYPKFFDKDYFGEIANISRFKVSFNKIAEWFKVSVGTAHKIIKRLYVEGKIQIYIGGYTALFKTKEVAKYILGYNPKTFVSKSGKIVVVNCNSYVFL